MQYSVLCSPLHYKSSHRQAATLRQLSKPGCSGILGERYRTIQGLHLHVCKIDMVTVPTLQGIMNRRQVNTNEYLEQCLILVSTLVIPVTIFIAFKYYDKSFWSMLAFCLYCVLKMFLMAKGPRSLLQTHIDGVGRDACADTKYHLELLDTCFI